MKSTWGVGAFLLISSACKAPGDVEDCPSAAPPASAPVAASTGSSPIATAAADDRKLTFRKRGELVSTLDLKEITSIPVETIKAYDHYYRKEKTFRAVPLIGLLVKVFPGEKLGEEELIFRAKDGYTVPMTGALATEPGAYVAIEDVDVPGWEPIGQERANPGPFYLIWAKKGQENVEEHPRPYQLASIEIARFEDVFPKTAPAGVRAPDAALDGFSIFKKECIRCHAINRQGGRVGPELNVPRSVVEYRDAETIKAYIKDPRAFRYTTMPPHPNLSDTQLDALVAYFKAMSTRKQDDEAGKP